MAVGYNPKIVTSNLVFAMDAANKKSFSPNTFSNPKDITSMIKMKKIITIHETEKELKPTDSSKHIGIL